MKISIRQLAPCGALFFAFAPVTHGETTAQLIDISDRVTAKAPLPAVFGNHNLNLTLQFDHAAAGSGDLTADFFQISNQLVMPLNKITHLQDGLTLSGDVAQKQQISITFPDLQQRAEILVRFKLVPHGAGASVIALGEMRFEVFPDSLTKEFSDLLQPGPDGTIPAVLFGPGRKLANFFTGLKVPFDQAGLDVPEQFETNRVYFGETVDGGSFALTQEIREKVRMAVFSLDPSLPAGIYSEQKSAATFVYVTSPILDNLSTDPRAQLALLKIMHYLIVRNPSTNPHP